MILTKTVTTTQEIPIEIKTPSFYKAKHYDQRYMITEDGHIVTVFDRYICSWSAEEKQGKKELDEAVSGIEITEEEFLAAFEKALSAFTKSVYPIAQTV